MVEADFQRFYHLNLWEAVFGEEPASIHRLAALFACLPPESAVHSFRDGHWWNLKYELQASLVEIEHSSMRILGMMAGIKPRDLPEQIQIERPNRGQIVHSQRGFVTDSPLEAFKLLKGLQ